MRDYKYWFEDDTVYVSKGSDAITALDKLMRQHTETVPKKLKKVKLLPRYID